MSSAQTEDIMTCGGCGASIYREHIHRGLAGMWGGRLLCSECIKPHRAPEPAPAPEFPPPNATLDSLPLAEVEEASPDEPSGSPVTANGNGAGARHVRTFHAKLSDAALKHMDDQINTWLKQHPGVSVKFANTTVGTFEAKYAEPTLILTMFY